MTVYCPYTDADVVPEETTPEHIVPLALGGHDRLQIPVDRRANAELGSKVDGALANEFFIQRRRAKYDVRGHSGRAPAMRMKKVKESGTGRPLQVEWGERLKIYDPVERRERREALSLEVSFKLDMDIRLRFLAKSFLSAGYFVYGDWFRRAVQHADARALMRGPRNLTEDELKGEDARVFSPFEESIPAEQGIHFGIQNAISSLVKGSMLVFLPGPRNLGIFGSILGVYLGMINVPADTSGYPRSDAHDLGHAVILSNGEVLRWSYRQLLMRILPELERLSRAHAKCPSSG